MPGPQDKSGRATLIYVGLSLGQRAVSFVLIPFLTTALTTSIYGVISTLTSLAALLAVVFGLSLEIFVLRRAVLSPGSKGPADYAVAWYLRIITPLVGICVGLLFASTGVGAFGAPGWALGGVVCGSALQASLLSHALPALRGRERLGRFAALSFINIGSQAGLTIGLVVVARLGLEGWVLTNVLAGAACWATSMVLSRPTLGRTSWRRMAEPLALTAPLLPHQVLMWALAFVDRVIMISIAGPSSTGIYSLAYQASTVGGMAFTEFNRALMPRYARLGDNPQSRPIRSLVSEHLGTILALTGLALPLIPILGHHVFHGPFAAATTYVGPLLISQLIYGAYGVPTNLLTLAVGNSRRMWQASGLGALSNVALNFALIPDLGIWGGVIANIAAYGLMATGAIWLESKGAGLLARGYRGARLPLLFVISIGVLGVAAFGVALGRPVLQLVLDGGSLMVAAGMVALVLRQHRPPPHRGAKSKHALRGHRSSPGKELH